MEEFDQLIEVLKEEWEVFTLTNIFTVGLIVALLIFRKTIARWLAALLFGVTRKALKGVERDLFIKKLTKPLAFFLLIVVMYEGVASMTFTENFRVFFHIGGFLFDILTRVYQVLLIVAVARVVLAALDIVGLVLMERATQTETKQDDQIIQFGIEAVKIIFLILVLLFSVSNIFGMNISSLLAGLGIGGLALALAAKESLENLLGSFTIFLDRPFTVGDLVTVGGITGTVEKVGFRSTRIRTLEKSYVTVPNKKMVDAELDNLTLRTFRRVRSVIGLTYGTTIEQMQAVVTDIQKLVDEHNHTNQDGQVRFLEFGPSSLDIVVVYFIDTMDYSVFLDVKQEINFEIMRIVQRHGTDFAFPTTTVHLAANTETTE